MSTRREFLPQRSNRRERTRQEISRARRAQFDYPAQKVGTAGAVTVYYSPSLGDQGLALATQLVGRVVTPYNEMQNLFGIPGAAVNVIVAPLSGQNDGSGGAYHMGCDFQSGGDLYLDATFASTAANPVDLEVGLYVAVHGVA